MTNYFRTLSRNHLAVLLLGLVPVPQNAWPVKHAARETPYANVRATFTIVGTVRDAASNAGLEAVQVLVGTAPPYAASALTGFGGAYRLQVHNVTRGSTVQVTIRRIGYQSRTSAVTFDADTVRVDASLNAVALMLSDIVVGVVAPAAERRQMSFATATMSTNGAAAAAAPAKSTSAANTKALSSKEAAARRRPDAKPAALVVPYPGGGVASREQYDRIEDNPFLAVTGNALSTFSIDIDRASYGNMRRFLNEGRQPPQDAVRIEELVNYFPYALDEPRGSDPIAITTEVAPAPWQPRHQLVRVALQARRIETENLPANNLVFLIDVSGSMSSPDKLPLVKQSLRLLVNQMREQDRVALVVYAGNAGLVLPSTSGANKSVIESAIERLEAGGSTAGGAGLALAYKTARESFIHDGNNRVILATDGDFNVGPSSDAEMERLIESKRSEGTYLTVLGFGTGNIQDAKMEKLAKIGNGNYAYVDNIAEARKTLVREMGATLMTVANDVKLQVEFNPSTVRAYRLIGYENRLLRNEDFADDKKDAGDIGAGHTVTAFYEVVPQGIENTVPIREADGLRYVTGSKASTPRAGSELLFVKLRYKKPGESKSRLMTHPVKLVLADRHTSDDFRFAASVASFGMLLRKSDYKGSSTGAEVLSMARGALGDDPGQYRAEFVRLVEKWQGITRVAADRN
ncbi:MAG: von Willebrand factor type A domain-containing protein [Phycisphaerae bacterium]|nr:von Willebrand factor type A domain-containing protein [Gemmatimonadaceae bacterium]